MRYPQWPPEPGEKWGNSSKPAARPREKKNHGRTMQYHSTVTTAIRFLFLLFALAWMALIFYLSSQPAIDITPLFPHQDKVFHAVIYGVLAVALLGSMRHHPDGYRYRQVAIAVLLATLYGLSDEFHQSFVPGRSPEAGDVLADAAGALLATLVFRWLLRTLHSKIFRPVDAVITKDEKMRIQQ